MILPRPLPRLAALALAASPSLSSAAVQPERGIGLPRDVSLHGERIDWLIQVTGIFVIVLFVVMVIWMLYAAIRHGPRHKAEYETGAGRHHVMVALSLSAVIFFVVDGNLFYNAMKDLSGAFWNFSEVEKDPGAVRIEVNAHQWAWDARYPGPDAKFNTGDDIVVLNDIRVPVDRPVIVQMASTDVIHSFYLPNFRIKQDAVPGSVNRFWFQAKATGEFDIACAQHCGTNHYKMKGRLIVLPPAEYDAWAQLATEDAKRAFDPEDKGALWGWEWRRF
jgi:cytochrome c oxidase subunit II